MKHYWPIRNEFALINSIAMKGSRIIIPLLLQRQILDQLHSNHMGIEKMRLLERESVYSVNMNADITNAVKMCSACLKQ